MSDEKIYIKYLKTGNNLGAFKVTADNYTTPTVSLINPNDATPGYDVSKTSFVVGSTQLDDTTNPDNDARMLFDKVKGAFRAGTATTTQWDNVNRGTNSIALGLDNKASGINSFAVGDSNTASGINAIAIGNNNLVYNSTTGTTPVAIGQDNTININSQWGIAIGKNNTTSTGNSPILIGNTNSSGSGHNSVAIGQSNTASSVNSVAIGQQCSASTAANATAIGQYCTATGANSFAIGYGTSGTKNTASGTGSFAIGYQNNVSGLNAVAIGKNCTVGDYSFVGGGYNTVTDRSIAINCADGVGSATSVNGAFSCAIGSNNTILGSFSHTYGSNNTVNCSNSIVLGRSATLADNNCFFWNGDNQTLSDVNSPIARSVSGEQYGTAVFWCAASGSFQIRFGGTTYENSDSSYNIDGRSFVSSSTGFSWSTTSSRDSKENLIEHDYSDTLTRIMDMPIYTYNFKTVAPGIKSIGPVAQDFNRLFPSDKDQLSIVERDMCGVALAGVKGVKLRLDSLSTVQQSQINTLIESLIAANTQITTLSASLTAAIVRITALEGEAIALKSKVSKLEKD